MKLNYVRRFSAYVSTFYHSKYITLLNAPQSVTSVMGPLVSTKINKPPGLPHFSGPDPVPKDEGSYEQWRF